MTEYQKIKNELVRLGWKPSPASGDHIRFEKEGATRPIIVSVTVSCEGRAIKNSYAEIRRIEPEFTLGRPNAKRQAQQEENPDKPLPGFPEWATVGEIVRYIAPEKCDFKMLDKPDSVMNRQYMIMDCSEHEPGKKLVSLSDGGDEFEVPLSDIAPWELFTCSACGKQYPISMRALSGKLCVHCMVKATPGFTDKPIDKARRSLSRETKEEKNEQEFMNFWKEFTDASFGKMTEEQRQKFCRKLEKTLNRLNDDARKRMIEKYPELNALLESVKASLKKITPYAAWKKLILQLSATIRVECREIYRPENVREQEAKQLASLLKTEYRFVRKQIKQTGEYVNIAELTVKDADALAVLWMHHPVTVHAFDEAFDKDKPLAVLLSCPSLGIRQYIVDNACGKGMEALNKLRKLNSVKEEELVRAEKDIAIQSLETLDQTVYANLADFKDDSGVRYFYRYALTDKNDFLSDAYFFCVVHVKSGNEELFARVRKVLSGIEYEGIKYAIALTYDNSETRISPENMFVVFPDEPEAACEAPATASNKPEPDNNTNMNSETIIPPENAGNALSQFTDRELWDELRSRGWGIRDGKLVKIIEQTME